jgi:hypothetical protein
MIMFKISTGNLEIMSVIMVMQTWNINALPLSEEIATHRLPCQVEQYSCVAVKEYGSSCFSKVEKMKKERELEKLGF